VIFYLPILALSLAVFEDVKQPSGIGIGFSIADTDTIPIPLPLVSADTRYRVLLSV